MKQRLLTVVVGATASLVMMVGPATAMHDSPAPVEDVAPSFSGHYSTPDVGSKGAARPWEAGPAWNR